MITKSCSRSRRLVSRAISALLLVGAIAAGGPARAERDATALQADPRFEVRLSKRKQQRIARDSATGTIAMIAIPLRTIAAQAWGVHPLDVQSDGDVELGVRYDVLLRPEDGSRGAASALLREILPQELGVIGRVEQRELPVQILRRLEDEPPLEPSSAQASSSNASEGELRATKLPMAELATLARWRMARPVVDETGLDGEYDWVLQWDPAGGRRAFLLAFRDLGLELVPGQRRLPILMLEKAAPQ